MSKMTEEEFLDLVASNMGARLSLLAENRKFFFSEGARTKKRRRVLMDNMRVLRDETYVQLDRMGVLRDIRDNP